MRVMRSLCCWRPNTPDADALTTNISICICRYVTCMAQNLYMLVLVPILSEVTVTRGEIEA